MSLCTVAYAHTAADLKGVGSAELQTLLDAATGLIENYCDRTFASTAYTATQDGTGTRWLYVRNFPIISLTSVKIESPDGSTETIAASNFRQDTQSGKIWFRDDSDSTYGEFPRGIQNITIRYTGGYATIPAPLQRACLLVARALYAQTSGGWNAAAASERMGEHQFTRVSASEDPMSTSARALVDSYVRQLFV